MGNLVLCCRNRGQRQKTGDIEHQKRPKSQSDENTPLNKYLVGTANTTRPEELQALLAEISQRRIDPSQTLDVSSVVINRNEGYAEVNEFTLIKTIGKGTYGKVKLALNRNDGFFYAIKMLNKRLLQRKRTVGMNNAWSDVLKEVSIMRRLHHDNIVKLYQVIDNQEADTLYLVMELMEGGCIQGSELEQGPVGEFLSHSYFIDIVNGLEYLHAHKIIHRDLKPQNLLLTENGVAKLSDFGVAQEFVDDDDSLQRTVGTPAFYSPELCSAGSVPRGRPSDVWALGVSLYCFVFGKVPFVGEHLMHLYETIRTSPLEFPEAGCSEELRDLLQAMMEKEPQRRITVPQIKQHPWFLAAIPPQASSHVPQLPTLSSSAFSPPQAGNSEQTFAITPRGTEGEVPNRFVDLEEALQLSSSSSFSSSSPSDSQSSSMSSYIDDSS